MSHPERTTPPSPMQRTALYDLHVANSAKMVPYAGYEMPVQYPLGVMKEHLHTRKYAGIFDVSHMGQITVRSRFGGQMDAAIALERLVPADLVALGPGRQRYTMFTNSEAGILDDIMVANLGSHLHLVVNASMKAQDEILLRTHLGANCVVERIEDRALLAVQGPFAESALSRLLPDIGKMKFMDVITTRLRAAELVVSRSGYTGEDGFEISIPASEAEGFVQSLMRDQIVALIGLGARDSLRLEAGLCLYGNDLDQTTTPIEAALEWSIQKSRRADGLRGGGFPGSEIVLREMMMGTRRRRVGLLPDGRAPIRGGALLYEREDATEAIGIVTSGGYGPTIDRPIAMGYVDKKNSDAATQLYADVRGKRLPAVVCALPFVAHRYKRG
jgi:aminomethyltransferase